MKGAMVHALAPASLSLSLSLSFFLSLSFILSLHIRKDDDPRLLPVMEIETSVLFWLRFFSLVLFPVFASEERKEKTGVTMKIIFLWGFWLLQVKIMLTDWHVKQSFQDVIH